MLLAIRFTVTINDILELEDNGLTDEEIAIIDNNPIEYFWTDEGKASRIKLESIARKMITDGEDYSIKHIYFSDGNILDYPLLNRTQKELKNEN